MEEDKKLEILKNYQKKEAQSIKKIFIIIFLLILLGKIFFLSGRVASVVKICFFVISFIIIINPFQSSRIIYVNEEFSLDGYFPKNTCLSNEV